jgi:hypothetical protein
MACRKKYSCWILLSCVVLAVFSGCGTTPEYDTPVQKDIKPAAKESTPVPVTKNIINRVKEDDQKKPKDFQYYISKKITLTLDRSKEQFTVESGELVITKRKRREQVTIAGNLPGLIYDDVTAKDVNGYLLDVYFEKDRNCFIKFHQFSPGDDSNYYLFYDDNKIIKYGDDYYTVDFDGIDPPYLLIKMKSKDISDSDERMASGITLP